MQNMDRLLDLTTNRIIRGERVPVRKEFLEAVEKKLTEMQVVYTCGEDSTHHGRVIFARSTLNSVPSKRKPLI